MEEIGLPVLIIFHKRYPWRYVCIQVVCIDMSLFVIPGLWLKWLNNKTVLLRDTVHQISRGESAAAGLTAGQLRPLTPRGKSGGPYHVITQFYFYPVMSKLQNSIIIYPWYWRHLTYASQDFRNPYCFECDVIVVCYCDITVVVLHTLVCF